MPDSFRSETISVGGRRVFSYSSVPAGAQRTFVLIHGIGVSHRYFKRLAHELAATDAVYALDLPGYGRVSHSDIRLNIDELSKVLEAFIVQQNIVNPILVGHSMGCQIVTKLAARTPALSNRLILLGPTINKFERWTPLQAFRLLQDSLRESLYVNRLIIGDYLRFGPWRYWWTRGHMMDDAIEERLPRIGVPTLVIRGANDPIARHEWAAHLTGLLPKGELLEIPDAGHVVQYRKAKEVAEACRRFLRP